MLGKRFGTLAEILFKQEEEDPTVLAEGFLDQKRCNNSRRSIESAQDIMAEWMNEDQEARKALRELFLTQGLYVPR